MRLILSKRLAYFIMACSLAIILACTVIRHTVRTVFVQSPTLASMPGVGILESDSELFEIVHGEPGRPVVRWHNTELHMRDAFRVPQCGDESVKVMGLVNDGFEYPVTLDSGYAGQILVTDTVVRESGLAIHPLPNLGSGMGGLCHIGRLRIGDLTIAHPAAVYLSGHFERRILGWATWVQKKILLGLDLMGRFGHIRIDNILGEVVFAMREPFVPADPNGWRHYPMRIDEEPSIAKELLWLDIPVAGEVRPVLFDTGADPGLTVTPAHWGSLSQRLHPQRRRRVRVRRPFGWSESQVVTVRRLDVAGMSVSPAEVYVTDSQVGGSCLGMRFFAETVLVLDFKEGRLWIKGPGGAPPSP